MDRDFYERVTITRSRGWHSVRLEEGVGRGLSFVVNFGNSPQDRAFADNVSRNIKDMGYDEIIAGGEIRFRRSDMARDRRALAGA